MRIRSISLITRLILISIMVAVTLIAIVVFFDIGVPSAIVLTAITLVAGFTTQLLLSDRQHQRTIETRIREMNAESYQQFLSFWLDMMLMPENQKRRTEGGMTKEFLVPKMNKISQPLILWSSNEFVRIYADFRRMLTGAERNKQALPPLETLFALEDLMIIMRQDMGHNIEGIRRGDLLTLFVNDLDKADRQIGAPWKLGQKPTLGIINK